MFIIAVLVGIVFPLMMAIVAISQRRKDWGIAILVSTLFGWGWLLAVLMLREFSKAEQPNPIIRVISTLVGG